MNWNGAKLKLKIYGHRRNAFGQVHLSDEKETWLGPDSWRSRLEARSFDVRLRLQGLGALPEVQAKFVEKALAVAGA